MTQLVVKLDLIQEHDWGQSECSVNAEYSHVLDQRKFFILSVAAVLRVTHQSQLTEQRSKVTVCICR